MPRNRSEQRFAQMPWIAVALACATILGVACSHTTRVEAPSVADIDLQIERLMEGEDVKGLALAIIEDGEVTHVAAYGKRNVEHNLPFETDTVTPAASFTKTHVVYMVLQLVDEGKLDLDRSIEAYLPKPLPSYPEYADLAADDRWRSLTPRIILNHATGFANFRGLDPTRKLAFNFDPGARYGYSGEGMNLLQFVLEKGMELDVGVEMKRRVFDRFQMSRTSMTWQGALAGDMADGYTIEGSYTPHNQRMSPTAAGSMDTTIADQARFWSGLMRGEGLSKESRGELSRPQLAITSATQFPSLTTKTNPRTAQIGLAAGLGVVTYRDKNGLSWFKGGHTDSTGNMVVCQEIHRRCAVMLSNSVRAERIYPQIVALVLGETATPWWWEYGPL